MEENIFGDAAPGDPPQMHVGTVFPSSDGGTGGALGRPNQRIGYGGACGANGCFESEIKAPTLGWWNDLHRAASPPQPPNSDYITLSMPAYSQQWVGNDLMVYEDGVSYMFFEPLKFDGPGSYTAGAYGNSTQHHYTKVDPGATTARANIADQLANHPEDFQPLIDWLDLQLSKPALVAQQLQPKLMFDKGEKWRPLSIDTFLNEHNPADGSPVQCVGPDRDHCTPIEGLATLRQHYAQSDRIIGGDYFTSQEPLSPDDYRTQSTTCELEPSGAAHALQECDNGPAAKIYYNALTRSAGYNYYDYWFFYRYNEFTADDHESDWEHVTVAQSLTDPTTFDWVNFYQHAYSNWSSAYHPPSIDGGLYLRDELTCDDGGSSSCGATDAPSGSRVWVYVAGGTHASYPDDCDGPCTQPGPATLEGDHGGQAPWSMNDTTTALVPFPAANGWAFPASGNWTDWPGKWGEQGIPASPANQQSFSCPWNGNPDDSTACTSRRRTATAHAAATRAATKCAGWYGASVAAAACSPSELRPAVAKGRVGHSGSIVLITPGDRRASAGAGIAQAVRRLLAPGDRIRVGGARPKDTEIMVRARFGKTVKRWVLRDLGARGRPLTVTVPTRSTGRPKIATG